jgi:hypothetical protein
VYPDVCCILCPVSGEEKAKTDITSFLCGFSMLRDQSSVAMEMIFTARPITAKIVCGVMDFTCLFVGFAHFLRL